MENIDLKNLTPKQKNLIIIACVLLAVLAADIFFIARPLVVKMSALNPKLKSMRSKAIKARKEAASLREYQKMLSIESEKSLGSMGRVLKSEGVPALLEEIARTAKDLNVKILQIKPAKDEGAKVAARSSTADFYELKVEIFSRAGFSELNEFIDRLEKNNTFIGVRNLSVRHDSDSDPYSHSVILTLWSYYSVDAPQKTKSSGKGKK